MATIKSVSQRFMGVEGLVLQPKAFSSGSKGWYAGGKLTDDEGNTYQCNFQAVIPHSKDDPTMKAPTNELTLGEQVLAAKTFSTGSKGFFAHGKMFTPEGNLQVQLQAVLVGSKPETLAKKEAAADAAEAAALKAIAKAEAKRAELAALKASVA